MSNVCFDFSGENYVVTGASSGMGRDITIALAAAGARVLAVARNIEALKEVKTQHPGNITVAPIDVCDYESLELAVKSFVDSNGKVKGCVHAAGIVGFTPLRAFDRRLANNIMNTSFWGGINLAQIVNKKKYSLQGCSTVLFSSIASKRGEKTLFVYSAAKAALNAAVKSIAKEIAGDKKRVNTILPGWVKTNMTSDVAARIDLDESVYKRHLLGLGEPADVTGMVLFLLSDDAKWITGTDIVVDGGCLSGGE